MNSPFYLFIPLIALILGVIFDIKSRAIPNRINLYIFMASLVTLGIVIFQNQDLRHEILLEKALTTSLCLIGGIILWQLKCVGAGDVKLAISISLFLPGPTSLALWVGLSLFWGAILGISYAIINKEMPRIFHTVISTALLKPALSNTYKIPFTIALLFGWINTVQIFGLV